MEITNWLRSRQTPQQRQGRIAQISADIIEVRHAGMGRVEVSLYSKDTYKTLKLALTSEEAHRLGSQLICEGAKKQ